MWLSEVDALAVAPGFSCALRVGREDPREARARRLRARFVNPPVGVVVGIVVVLVVVAAVVVMVVAFVVVCRDSRDRVGTG